MQCHFEPLTGEVVISNRAPPPQPAAKALVRKQKKSKGALATCKTFAVLLSSLDSFIEWRRTCNVLCCGSN